MKNIAIALAFVAALAAPANAADPYNPEVPAESYEAPAYAFTGFGVGIDGGGQFTSWDVNGDGCSEEGPCVPIFDFDGISSDGLIGGAHLEYMFAVGRARFGAYAEGGFSNVNTTLDLHPAPGFAAELQQDSYYGAGLKAGATVYGSTLVYVRGGYDWSQWTASATGFDEANADVGSWLIGGGIETMVSDNWSLGLGADYLIVDDVEFDGEDETAVVEDSEMLRIKARLTRRF